MNIIEYDPIDGEVVSDGQIQQYVKYVVNNFNCDEQCYFVVGSELMINAFRLAVAQGKIDYQNVQFKFQDKYLAVDKDGMLPGVIPIGFCDYHVDVLMKLL